MKYPKLTIIIMAVVTLAVLLLGQAIPGLAQTDLPTNITAEMIADLRAEWQSGSSPVCLARHRMPVVSYCLGLSHQMHMPGLGS